MKLSSLKQRKVFIPIIIGVIVVSVFTVRHFFFSVGAVNEVQTSLRQVKLLTSSDYALGSAEVRAVGQVEALDAITFSSQASATVANVPVELGQKVYAGQVLVELDHRDADAQLAQASAAVSRARAALSQRLAGPSSEEIAQSEASVRIAEASFAQAEAGLSQTKANNESAISAANTAVERAKQALDNGGASNDQTVQGSYDSLVLALRDGVLSGENSLQTFTTAQYAYFLNADTLTTDLNSKKEVAVRLLLGASNAGRWNNVSIGALDGGAKGAVENLSATDYVAIKTVAVQTQAALEATRTAMDALRGGLDSYAVSGVTSADKAAADGARASLDGALKGINAALQAVKTSELAVDSASDSLSLAYAQALQDAEFTKQKTAAALESAEALLKLQEASLASSRAGHAARIATPRDVDLAGMYASLDEAQAAYSSAYTNFSKRLVVAPFAGEIAAIPVKVGDLVSPGMRLAALVNTSGLQIRTAVSENDRRLLQIGAPVIIDGAEGVIANIAPSVDPTTKKVEIIVAILNEDSPLTVGSFVEIKMTASPEATGGSLLLPLSAVKVSSTGSFVYGLSESSETVEIPVVIGRTIGESVEVISGLEGDWKILSSVRGVRVGEKVTVTE